MTSVFAVSSNPISPTKICRLSVRCQALPRCCDSASKLVGVPAGPVQSKKCACTFAPSGPPGSACAAAATVIATSKEAAITNASFFIELSSSSFVVKAVRSRSRRTKSLSPSHLRCFGSGRRGWLAAVGAILHLAPSEVKPLPLTADARRKRARRRRAYDSYVKPAPQEVRVPGEGVEPSRPLAGTADKSLLRLSDPPPAVMVFALLHRFRSYRRWRVFRLLRSSCCHLAVTLDRLERVEERRLRHTSHRRSRGSAQAHNRRAASSWAALRTTNGPRGPVAGQRSHTENDAARL